MKKVIYLGLGVFCIIFFMGEKMSFGHILVSSLYIYALASLIGRKRV